jgi:CelD/BcsL family acetyltransferase involved in cellulose biosynthesis
MMLPERTIATGAVLVPMPTILDDAAARGGAVGSQPMSLRVTSVQPLHDPRWDAFVDDHPAGQVYHRSGWLQALHLEYRQPVVALACETDDGAIVGVLPLVRTRGLPFGVGGKSAGPRLSSLPRTPVAGPIASSRDSLALLVSAAVDMARADGLRLQLKMVAPELDGVAPDLVGVPWRATYVVALPDDPEALRFGDARNHSTVRRAIKKAQREGVVVRLATDEAELRAWYRLYLDVCRWRGQPARTYRFFAGLWRHLRPGGHMELLLAERGEGRDRELLGGNVLLLGGGTVSYAFNGRRRDALSSRPNDLLHWEAMRSAMERGYRRYDLGEVDEQNPGLARYKAKWGAGVEHTVRYYAPPLPDEEATGYGAAESQGRLKTMLLAAWQRVPLPLTQLAGDRIYRYL